jgi:hypothetical protein
MSIAFSCTWYPHMKLHMVQYSAAGAKAAGRGRRQSATNAGSIEHSVQSAAMPDDTWGSTAKGATPTRPPAAGGQGGRTASLA